MTDTPFWKRKRLEQMTRDEWESLCDGCGKCCLHKLEDEDTGEIAMTDVSCRYLDLHSCRCSDYASRQANVPDCVKLTARNLPKLRWLPDTCAYRLVYHGNDLPEWHHLITGDRDSIHRAGQSVRGQGISEDEVEDLERHVTDWLNSDETPWSFVPGPPRTPGKPRG